MSSRYPHVLVLHVSCAEQTWGAAGVEKSRKQDQKDQSVGGDRGDHVGTELQKTIECGEVAFFKCGEMGTGIRQKSQFTLSSLCKSGTYRCDDMCATKRLLHHLWVFGLFAPQVKQKVTGFRDILETSRRIMVNEDLTTINSLVIAENMRHTIICAPLSHISFTIFFLAREEGCADSMNAESATAE